jgi:hypothetical protein
MYDGLVHHHLCPEPGALAYETGQLAEMDICPVHPATIDEPPINSVRDGGDDRLSTTSKES